MYLYAQQGRDYNGIVIRITTYTYKYIQKIVQIRQMDITFSLFRYYKQIQESDGFVYNEDAKSIHFHNKTVAIGWAWTITFDHNCRLIKTYHLINSKSSKLEALFIRDDPIGPD